MKKWLLSLLLSLLFTGIRAQCWSLAWQDNFDGNTLSAENWTPSIGPSYNNELEYYSDRSENIRVENGLLKLIALKETYNGQNYTSGRIESRQKVDFTYGRFEASMKLPAGQGLWPAFWLLPSTGTWPDNGEIDIMELLGHEPAKTYGTCHYTVNGVHDSKGDFMILPNGASFTDTFHVFAVEWTPDSITWLVDGQPYFTTTKSQIGAANWPFKADFYIILNLAVGGNWPGNPNSSTVFPATMAVEWVKVYQHNPDIRIQGPGLVEPGATATYRLPDWAGANYQWSISGGGTIISGQNTSTVTVTWTATGEHSLTCNTGNSCGPFSTATTITVNANQWLNPGFEDGAAHWTFQSGNGILADFQTITSPLAPHGTQIGNVNVTTLGQNSWDIQLVRPGITAIKDSAYTFRFCARAGVNGQETQVNFLNPVNFTNYAWKHLNLTTIWTQYSMSFVAPYSGNLLFTQDFGFDTGAFFCDNYYFGRSSLSPAAGDCTQEAVGLNTPGALELVMYPNPASRELFINLAPWQGKSIKIMLYNSLGVNVLEQNIETMLDAVQVVDLSRLNAGTYVVKVESGGGVQAVGKVVVLRN